MEETCTGGAILESWWKRRAFLVSVQVMQERRMKGMMGEAARACVGYSSAGILSHVKSNTRFGCQREHNSIRSVARDNVGKRSCRGSLISDLELEVDFSQSETGQSFGALALSSLQVLRLAKPFVAAPPK